MIKADDLRRGNRVRSKTHNLDFAAVESVLPSGIILLQYVSTYDHIDKIEPIQVSKDLLKNYGFDQFEKHKYTIQVGNQLYLDIDLSDLTICITPETWRGSSCTLWRTLGYFHDLQNLYQDLTGNDLKFKE